MMQPKKPALHYHGGKWRLAKWIISYFPPHEVYVEPFGGSASVLIQKPRSRYEIYNELDKEITNFFIVLRDPDMRSELIRLIKLTPYSEAEFYVSYVTCSNLVDQARQTLVRSFMGFSSASVTRSHISGFKKLSIDSKKSEAHSWAKLPENLDLIGELLAGVEIRDGKALDCIKDMDSEDTLQYLDPPYLASTRHQCGNRKEYRHEMTEAGHIELAETIMNLKSMFIISGYDSGLYDELYAGWHKVSTMARGQSGKKQGTKVNKEVLWISPNARSALPLFESAGVAV